jgi:flagellar hook-associated protein 3 FlgL
MAIVPTNLARVSNTLRTSVTMQGMSKTQAELLKVQNQITTGNRIITPSEDAGSASIVMQLQKTIENRTAYLDNITKASSQLSQVDQTVEDVSDLLQQAQSLASANVGSDVTPDARAGAVEIVKSIYAQMLSLGNAQFGGAYLFGGDKSNSAPFVEALGGIQFVGSNGQLSNAFDQGMVSTFTVGASEVFGRVEARAGLGATLTPALTASTRLADLAGANGTGVKAGSFVLSDGSTSKAIDLSGADSVGDVITRINNAAVGGITAAIDASGTGIELTSSGGDNITVSEAATGGTTAADLGILRTVGLGAGAALTGSSPNPKLTALTDLSTLNGGTLDLGSGIVITNGLQTATLDFSADSTVQDMLHRINNSGTGVRAAVSADGTGIEIYNTVEGTDLTIGENGGLTATQLGVRTFTADTALASLNGGKGVRLGATPPGLRVTRSDGVDVDVDISSAKTVGDVIAAINTAGGGTVTAALAASGNGIVLADIAGGIGATTVTSINGSGAAEDLGLDTASAGGVVTGRDVAPVRASGVFAHLASLRDALQRGDQAGITAAADALKDDYDQAVRTRGSTGAKLLDLETRKSRIGDQNVATATALANLREVDPVEAYTRFQMLQTALQATLQSAGKTMNLSLLDFIS